MKKGLTLTIIFEAQSLNYDEGFGNLSQLKKMRRGNGEAYTFSSRQSLRYSIFTQGAQQFGWKPYDVVAAGSGDKKVTQAAPHVTLLESEEYDLFGSMQTNVPFKSTKKEKAKAPKKEGEKNEKENELTVTVTRIAPVRMLPAIAVEPFFNDVEMLTNKYQADKIQVGPNISNSEQHRSLYRYTIAVDLDRIGTNADEFFTKVSPNKEADKESEDFKNFVKALREEKDPDGNAKVTHELRAKRVYQLLDVVKTLWRDIRGRREDLKPLFIIGGVYANKNPFFENIVMVDWQNGKPAIVLESLKQALNRKYSYLDSNGKMQEAEVSSETYIGIVDGKFVQSTEQLKNEQKDEKKDKLKGSVMSSPDAAIDEIKIKVAKAFDVKPEDIK